MNFSGDWHNFWRCSEFRKVWRSKNKSYVNTKIQFPVPKLDIMKPRFCYVCYVIKIENLFMSNVWRLVFCVLDDNLWIIFSVEFLNEALRSHNHKTCFSFAQKSWPFWLNGRKSPSKVPVLQAFLSKTKTCLWLEASLRNSTEKFIYKSSSN